MSKVYLIYKKKRKLIEWVSGCLPGNTLCLQSATIWVGPHNLLQFISFMTWPFIGKYRKGLVFFSFSSCNIMLWHTIKAAFPLHTRSRGGSPRSLSVHRAQLSWKQDRMWITFVVLSLMVSTRPGSSSLGEAAITVGCHFSPCSQVLAVFVRDVRTDNLE